MATVNPANGDSIDSAEASQSSSNPKVLLPVQPTEVVRESTLSITPAPSVVSASPIIDEVAKQSGKIANELSQQRVAIAAGLKPIFWVFVGGISVYISLLFALMMLFNLESIDKIALSASLQITFGMFLGFIIVYLGFMVTWIGINAEFQLSLGQGPESQGKSFLLKSASPGLAFALGGIVIIVASLYKTFEFNINSPLPLKNGSFGTVKNADAPLSAGFDKSKAKRVETIPQGPPDSAKPSQD